MKSVYASMLLGALATVMVSSIALADGITANDLTRGVVPMASTPLIQFGSAANDTRAQASANKTLVEHFWNALFNQHDLSVIDTTVGDTYTQHNPTFSDGKVAFKAGMTEFLQQYPESSAQIKHIGADGDLVYIHNFVQVSASDPGQAAMDIFRVKDGKIVEHWDVLQDMPQTSANDNGMF